MPNSQQSSIPVKCILINTDTMGSLQLDMEQIHLIILGLLGFADEVTASGDKQHATDLADTIHRHVFDRQLPMINQPQTFQALRTLAKMDAKT